MNKPYYPAEMFEIKYQKFPPVALKMLKGYYDTCKVNENGEMITTVIQVELTKMLGVSQGAVSSALSRLVFRKILIPATIGVRNRSFILSKQHLDEIEKLYEDTKQIPT